jgi:predicted transcriptional regulator
MVTSPTVHDPRTTVGELRAFFRDDHVHIALLVDENKLVGTIERSDLEPVLNSRLPAATIASLHRRTIRPDHTLSEAFTAMKRDDRRRLAVTSDDSTLLGLLCLKQSGLGFCSDADVRSRNCANWGQVLGTGWGFAGSTQGVSTSPSGAR